MKRNKKKKIPFICRKLFDRNDCHDNNTDDDDETFTICKL